MRIKACKRGPLLVEGTFELVDARGQRIDLSGRRKVLLCRCGASQSTPLCDGTHNRIAFQPDNECEPEREPESELAAEREA